MKEWRLSRVLPPFNKGRSREFSRFWAILALLVCVGIFLRTTYALRAYDLGACFVPDSASYLSPAQNLLGGSGYLNQQLNPEITRPPGYPAFLATVMALTDSDLNKVLIVQAIVLSIIPLVVCLTAARIFDWGASLFACALLSISPWMIAWGARFTSDGLAALFVSLMFLWMAVLATTRGWSAKTCVVTVLLGLSTAAYVLTRPLWPVILLVAVVPFLARRDLRLHQRTMLAIVVLVFSAAPVGWWAARNHSVVGSFVVSDVGPKTAYWYLAQRTLSLESGVDRFVLKRNAMTASKQWDGSPRELTDRYKSQAYRILKDHPGSAVAAFSLSLAEQLVHPDSGIVFSGLGFHPRIGAVALAAYWALMFLLAAVGVIQIWRSPGRLGMNKKGAVLGMVLVATFVMSSSGLSFGGGARLRLPVELVVSMIAGFGAAEIIFRSGLNGASIWNLADNENR